MSADYLGTGDDTTTIAIFHYRPLERDDTLPLRRVEPPEPPVALRRAPQPPAGPGARGRHRRSRSTPPEPGTRPRLAGAARAAARTWLALAREVWPTVVSVAVGVALGALIVLGFYGGLAWF